MFVSVYDTTLSVLAVHMQTCKCSLGFTGGHDMELELLVVRQRSGTLVVFMQF